MLAEEKAQSKCGKVAIEESPKLNKSLCDIYDKINEPNMNMCRADTRRSKINKNPFLEYVYVGRHAPPLSKTSELIAQKSIILIKVISYSMYLLYVIPHHTHYAVANYLNAPVSFEPHTELAPRNLISLSFPDQLFEFFRYNPKLKVRIGKLHVLEKNVELVSLNKWANGENDVDPHVDAVVYKYITVLGAHLI